MQRWRLLGAAAVLGIAVAFFLFPLDGSSEGSGEVSAENRSVTADSVGNDFVGSTFRGDVVSGPLDFVRAADRNDTVYTESWNWSSYLFRTELYFSDRAADAAEPYQVEWSVVGPGLQGAVSSSGEVEEELTREVVGEFLRPSPTAIDCSGFGCTADWSTGVYEGRMQVIQLRSPNSPSAVVVEGCAVLQDAPEAGCFDGG